MGTFGQEHALAGPVPQVHFGEQGWGQAWSLDPGSQPREVNGSPRSAGGKGWQGEWSGCAVRGVSLWGQSGTAVPSHAGCWPWHFWGWCLPAVPAEKSPNPL